MKKSMFLRSAVVIGGIALLASCNGGGSKDATVIDSTTTNKMAEDKNDAKFNKAGENDAKAVVDAYNSSLMEQRLSDTVASYTKNKEVKMLAIHMANAHATLDSTLQALAAKKQITLPSDLTVSDVDKIKSMAQEKPADMNKDYVDKLVSAHKDAISFYDKNSTAATDNDIKAFFANTLPDLRKHLDMATDCQNKMK